MRLLVVTYRFPAYTGDAVSNTVFSLIKYFSVNHEVCLVGLAPRHPAPDVMKRLTQYCQRVEVISWPKWRGALSAARGLSSAEPLQMWYYRSNEFAQKVRQVIAEEHIELAYGYHLRSSQFLAHIDSIPRVIAIQPAQVLHFGRRHKLTRNPLLKLLYGIEERRLIGYEAAVAEKFDSCLLISEIDRLAIDPNCQLRNVVFNPHGTDVGALAPKVGTVRAKDTLVFSGSMYMDTNSDAALYLYRTIMPLIWSERPETKLLIVGKNPTRAVRKLANDSRITVTGTVPDIRPYLWKASVGVNPIRMAAGMQNKLIEGLAAGLPMVITPEANEGIGAPENEAVLIGRNPQEFATKVLLLLGNPTLAEALSAAGSTFVRDNWSWEHHFQDLEEVLKGHIAEGLATHRLPKLVG